MLLILRSRAAFSLLSGIVRIDLFFLVGKIAGAWLPMADRRLYRRRRRLPTRILRADVDPCANASGLPIRTTSAIDRIVFRISVLPLRPFVHYRAGASIVAQLRRPWAAQS